MLVIKYWKSILMTLVILFLSFAKPTSLIIEDKFGTFSLNCRTFEKGSAIGAYGFGLAYCNKEINDLSKVVHYEEIDHYIQFLKIARGSGAEVETQIVISKDLGFIEEAKCEDLISKITEIMKMINGLINYLKTKP